MVGCNAEQEAMASIHCVSLRDSVKLAERHLVAMGDRRRLLPAAHDKLRAFWVLIVLGGEDHRGLGFQGGSFPVHNTEMKTETLRDDRLAVKRQLETDREKERGRLLRQDFCEFKACLRN